MILPFCSVWENISIVDMPFTGLPPDKMLESVEFAC